MHYPWGSFYRDTSHQATVCRPAYSVIVLELTCPQEVGGSYVSDVEQ